MLVFKFGGGCLRDAASFKQLNSIMANHIGEKIIVVVSAFGKMTNALEDVVKAFYYKQELKTKIETVKTFHNNIVEELFESHQCKEIKKKLLKYYNELDQLLLKQPGGNFDFEYDQIVSLGELMSSGIVSYYLKTRNFNSFLLDVRTIIKTNSIYRNASLFWELSGKLSQEKIKPILTDYNVVVTQGFIGSSESGNTTTLGREGSDFSAAIMASLLHVNQLTIWKDVAGIFNADPNIFSNAVKIDQLSYFEAIELAYYGASVLHPKTIKPLKKNNIALHVRSFLNLNETGTYVNNVTKNTYDVPFVILKSNQVLLNIETTDLSFMDESHLVEILKILNRLYFKINLLQNSAVSLKLSITNNEEKFTELKNIIQCNYQLSYRTNVDLLTVRYYNEKLLKEIISKNDILLEQRTNQNASFVISCWNKKSLPLN